MKKTLSSTVLGLLVLSASLLANAASCPELYNHQYKTLQGEQINLCDYQDKPILVVNTASKCGFASQFEALEGLYKKHKSQGLLVIGFPSNDFKQELSEDKAIGDFCKATYGVNFPMTSKSAVSGANANAFYKQLAAKSGQAPMWNFYKYVILPGGKQVYAFESTVAPESAEIFNKIKPFLK
ncbi:MAG: glutathione peroxidase [Pseudomonadota bacterium]